jgi:hypothetical protein
MNRTDYEILNEQGIDADVIAEMIGDDPVYQKVGYARYVSSSQGWRNGKRRIRRRPREVRLVQYPKGGRWRTWERFPFDEYVTEIMDSNDAEELQRRIMELWGY